MKAMILFCILGGWAFGAHAEETAAPQAATTEVATKTPNFVISYSYSKWSLKGTSTANTNIYKFGDSTVDLHLVTATWLYSPKWTFLLFAPYLKYMVETIYEPTPAGLNYKTKDYTEGLGDLRFMAMTPLWFNDGQALMGDVSITAPTGSTDKYFTSAPTQRAAYNMQLGSGTPDLIGGLTYSKNVGAWDASARGEITIRGGKNAESYNLGDEFQTHWATHYTVCPEFKIGAVFNYKARQRVQGHDDKYELYNHYVSQTDPSISGDGHQYYHDTQIAWDTSLVARLQTVRPGPFSAYLEGGLPFWQGAINKDDIRLDIQYWFAGGVNATF